MCFYGVVRFTALVFIVFLMVLLDVLPVLLVRCFVFVDGGSGVGGVGGVGYIGGVGSVGGCGSCVITTSFFVVSEVQVGCVMADVYFGMRRRVVGVLCCHDWCRWPVVAEMDQMLLLMGAAAGARLLQHNSACWWQATLV